MEPLPRVPRPASVASSTGAPQVARVRERNPLHYAEGADGSIGRPAHVRAASGMAWWPAPGPARLAVVQDDACFIALVDPRTRHVEAVALPAIDGQRTFAPTKDGKAKKLDLESATVMDVKGRRCVVAFGSGSLRGSRDRIVVLAPDDRMPNGARVKVVDGGLFYDALRAHPMLRGHELNLEGAVVDGDGTLRLLQRGNGRGPRGERAINAVIDVDAGAFARFLVDPRSPPPVAVRPIALGDIDGVPLTLTDGALAADGSLVLLAAAEDSPDAVADGVVVGAKVGRMTRDGSLSWAPLVDEHGRAFDGKPEGVAVDPVDARRAYVVVDPDDPDRAADLLVVELPA